MDHLVQCGTSQGPLFILEEDGAFLTRHYLASAVRGALSQNTMVTASA